jgi:hypothetical protein
MRFGLLAALCGLLGSAAQAQAQEDSKGPFVGFSVGSFRYSDTDASTGVKIADNTSMRRLLGGYRFTQNMSLEASWSTTDDIEASVAVDDPILGPARLDTRADFEVLTVRVVGTRPLERVVLFGGFGLYDGELDETGSFEDDFGITTIHLQRKRSRREPDRRHPIRSAPAHELAGRVRMVRCRQHGHRR